MALDSPKHPGDDREVPLLPGTPGSGGQGPSGHDHLSERLWLPGCISNVSGGKGEQGARRWRPAGASRGRAAHALFPYGGGEGKSFAPPGGAALTATAGRPAWRWRPGLRGQGRSRPQPTRPDPPAAGRRGPVSARRGKARRGRW